MFSLISAIPNAAQRATGRIDDDDEDSYYITTIDDKRWEYEMDQMNVPDTPGFGLATPYTPKTMAFSTLEGNTTSRPSNKSLPLRHHIAMGNETYKG